MHYLLSMSGFLFRIGAYGMFAVLVALAHPSQGNAQPQPTSPRRAPAVTGQQKSLLPNKHSPRVSPDSGARSASPRQTLSGFSQAWAGEDLPTLLSVFGDRRVSIDVGAIARAGEYGPAQVRFLFKRIFARTDTRAFTLKRYRPHADAPHGICDWLYVDERNGGSHRVRLVVSLRKEAGLWVIDEIRSASRP